MGLQESPMKLAYIHTNTVRSSWTLWSGARALRALGHDVLDVAVPTDHNGRVASRPIGFSPPRFPDFATLKACDRVIVCAAEYCDPYMYDLYGQAWTLLPKQAIYVESRMREDIAFRYVNDYAHRFWPDPLDVTSKDDHLLPSFVDTEMFSPDPRVPKAIDVGFMGTLYAKREAFLQSVQTPIVCGQVSAFGLQGEAHETWTRLYVRALRSMRIHVDLPSNNPGRSKPWPQVRVWSHGPSCLRPSKKGTITSGTQTRPTWTRSWTHY
jgi:hypothetical protein